LASRRRRHCKLKEVLAARLIVAAIMIAAFGACARTRLVECGENFQCPRGDICDPIAKRCLSPEQVAACNGAAEDAPCSVQGVSGKCESGACIFDSCGDGQVTAPEQCDGTESPGACLNRGFDYGALVCTGNCSIDVATCGELGWKSLFTPTVSNFTGIWGSSESDIYVVSNNGPAVHFDGEAWSQIDFGEPDVSLTDIMGSGPNDIYAVGSEVYHYDGASWSRLEIGGSILVYTSVWVASKNRVWVAGFGGKIMHFDGAKWSEQPTGVTAPLAALWGSAPQNVYAVGLNGTVLRYDGQDWSPVDTGVGSVLLADVSGTSENDVWIVGRARTVAHYDGVAWQVTNLPPGPSGSDHLVKVRRFGNSTFVFSALGDVWMKAGTSWVLVDSADIINDLWVGGQNLYAAARNGVVPYNSGNLWAVDPSAPFAVTDAIRVPDGQLFALSLNNVLRLDSSGWVQVTAIGPGALCRRLWMDTTGVAVAVRETGTIEMFDGANWTPLGLSFNVKDIWGSDAENVFAVGAGGNVARFNGGTWSPPAIVGTSTLNRVLGTGGQVFAAGESGTMFRFDGASWQPIPTGITDSFTSLFALAPNHVYAGTDRGDILLYDGAGWKTVAGMPGGTPVSDISGTGASDVFAVGTSTILHFDGVTWAPVRVPAALSLTAVEASTEGVFLFGGASLDASRRLLRARSWTVP
jgi:hypothetical protein